MSPIVHIYTDRFTMGFALDALSPLFLYIIPIVTIAVGFLATYSFIKPSRVSNLLFALSLGFLITYATFILMDNNVRMYGGIIHSITNFTIFENGSMFVMVGFVDFFIDVVMWTALSALLVAKLKLFDPSRSL